MAHMETSRHTSGDNALHQRSTSRRVASSTRPDQGWSRSFSTTEISSNANEDPSHQDHDEIAIGNTQFEAGTNSGRGRSSEASGSRSKEVWSESSSRPVETWWDFSRNVREAKEWLNLEMTKKQADADFEKGLLSGRETIKYIKATFKKEKVDFQEDTDSSREYNNRYEEIQNLYTLLRNQPNDTEIKELLTTMWTHSNEIHSYTGHIHGYIKGGSLIIAHIEGYLQARATLLEDNAEILGLTYSPHTGSDAYHNRESEIDDLCTQTGQTRENCLLFSMHYYSDEIHSYGESPYGAGKIIEGYMEKYQEAKEQFKRQYPDYHIHAR